MNKLKKLASNDAFPLKDARHVMTLPSQNLYGASNLNCRQTQCRFIEIRCGAPR